jgi:hypothetical protein
MTTSSNSDISTAGIPEAATAAIGTLAVTPEPDPDAALLAACDAHDRLWAKKNEAAGWALDLAGTKAMCEVEDTYNCMFHDLECAILAFQPRTARGLMCLLDTLGPSSWEEARDPTCEDDDAETRLLRAVRSFLEDLAIKDGTPARAYHELPPHLRRQPAELVEAKEAGAEVAGGANGGAQA